MHQATEIVANWDVTFSESRTMEDRPSGEYKTQFLHDIAEILDTAYILLAIYHFNTF